MGTRDAGVSVRLTPSSLNLPNALTMARLLLVPLFVWLMLQDGPTMRWAALGVFCLASLTDLLDGHIARARGLITAFGKIADPIADKALTLGAFFMLSFDAQLSPWWLTLLVAFRELGITAMRALLLRRGIVVPANAGGKVKTSLQMAFLIALMVPWMSLLSADNAMWVSFLIYLLGGVMLAVTMWSGLVYVAQGIRLWRATSVQQRKVES